MGLYPTTVLEVSTAILEPNVIMAGSLIVIPIDMSTTQMTEIELLHMSATQDFSLRAWLSEFEDGIPFSPGYYSVLKFGGNPFVVYSPPQTPRNDTFAVAVSPGTYYLNILNLTNEGNVFGFAKEDVA